MQKDAQQEGQLSGETQDVLKFLVSAFRIVKLYPPNNPVYSQSLTKAFETLSRILETMSEYRVGVQKTYFTIGPTAVGKEAHVNRSIAQDLFAKGIREIVFSVEITESELQDFCQSLALSQEELAMKNGISTVLWEQGVTHIKVAEAGLDEVITANTGSAGGGTSDDETKTSRVKSSTSFAGKTLVLGDLKTDPEGFGAGMLEFALRTRAPHESVEDRLFTLYQQAGLKISRDHSQESDELFDGLARSVLALEHPYREALIAGKLFGDLDIDIASAGIEEQQYPNEMQEIRSARYSDVCSVEQVAVLLRHSSAKKITPPPPPPAEAVLAVEPIPEDVQQLVLSIHETTPEQMQALRKVSEAGMESDIIDAAVRTLVSLIPLVKSPLRKDAPEQDLVFFSAVIHQLEDILAFVLKGNKYDLATKVLKALRTPVDPLFRPRVAEALKKTATKPIVKDAITDMRKHSKGSPEYTAAYDYLANLEQKSTEALLELLSEEKDRNTRIFLLDLLKDFGKDQYTLLSEHIADGRWYVVRNIVSILAESKSDQALALLRKAADHSNVQIRQEVIKALTAIGGKKASSVLAKFLRDPNETLQLLAIRSFPEMSGLGPEEARPLIEFLDGRRLTKKGQETTVAAIKALGKIGGGDAAVFLHEFTRVRWWRSRKLQDARRDAAERSIDEITRRQDGGRAQR